MNNLNHEEIVRQLRLAKNQLEMTLEDWRGRIEAPTLFAAQQNTIEALGSSADLIEALVREDIACKKALHHERVISAELGAEVEKLKKELEANYWEIQRRLDVNNE
jgi:hypothetical protein